MHCPEELGNALILAAENNKKFNVYNVGTGKNYTLNELVGILNRHLNKNIKPEYIENPMKDTYVYYTKADIRKTENGIGFKAKISLDEGRQAHTHDSLLITCLPNWIQ